MLAWTVLKVWECKWRQGTDSSVEGGCRQPDNDKTAERLDAGRWPNPAWKLVSSINGRQSHPAPSSAIQRIGHRSHSIGQRKHLIGKRNYHGCTRKLR